MNKLSRILAEEGLVRVAATTDIHQVAREYLSALQKIPAPYPWMRYKRVKVEPRWDSIDALHGFIPRELRHSGEGKASREMERKYQDWEGDSDGVMQRFQKKYPEFQFGSQRY